MTNNGNESFRVGVTFHSFTNEYCALQWSFEDMMFLASLLGGGVEIVGPAHHRGFPRVTAEFECAFKSSVERNELTPTCYGSYADPFMLPGRDLSPDELVEYTIPQLNTAALLGFPVVRLQYFTHPIVERLLPYAEKLNLKMGYELHVPLTIESPETRMLIEQVARIGSPHLGLVPDTGIFARSVSRYLIRQFQDEGVGDELIHRAIALWEEKVPILEALGELTSLGADRRAIGSLERIWGSYGHSEPSALAEIMRYIVHVHGKFFTMVDGEEPDIRFEETVQALVVGEYKGWISSEYEGRISTGCEGPPEDDTFAVVEAHQAMLRRFQAKYLTAVPR